MSNSNSKSQSDVDLIIKEFLFNSLSNEHLNSLRKMFDCQNGQNFSVNGENMDYAYPKIEIKGIFTSSQPLSNFRSVRQQNPNIFLIYPDH